MLRRSLSGEICVVDVIVGMSCGYESKKISVIPRTRENCGYERKKVGVIPSIRRSCGYKSKKISMIPTVRV